MKTARFSQVVEKCGKPEIYLLLSKEDPAFRKALKAGRIMTVLTGTRGPRTEYGAVGFEEKQRGQILLFPKSLKAFAGSKIVGIKFDVFAGESEKATPLEKPKKDSSPRQNKRTKKAEKKPARERIPKGKVIPFPKDVDEAEEDSGDLRDLKVHIRQALRQLEKGNAVAAYNLLKKAVEN